MYMPYCFTKRGRTCYRHQTDMPHSTAAIRTESEQIKMSVTNHAKAMVDAIENYNMFI